MSVDPVKRKAGLASRKVSPWGKFRVATPKGRESAQRYWNNEKRVRRDG